MEDTGIEPVTSALQRRRRGFHVSATLIRGDRRYGMPSGFISRNVSRNVYAAFRQTRDAQRRFRPLIRNWV
jgi:hypothetical protein